MNKELEEIQNNSKSKTFNTDNSNYTRNFNKGPRKDHKGKGKTLRSHRGNKRINYYDW